MAVSALIGAWLAGLLGGAHCVAMCGGFVAALSAAREAARPVPLRRAGALVVDMLPYHGGRVASYALLGAAFGGAGGLALSAATLLPLQRGLYVAANAFLLLLAVAVATRSGQVAWLQRAGGSLFTRLVPLLRGLRTRDSRIARVGMGLVWGLVPCGLTYSVLPLALFSGSAGEGAAVMLAFGVGTLPSLLAAGWVAGRARRWLDRPVVRYGAALLLTAFALAGIWRALFGPMASGQGPFCLVP
ncbi:MAG: sulfite exporter TauE/SafE family protein [Betaproteobacteria bacterium]|nr:sulfite exporter TauE/SafE family protein [Betaproteobacteria bacterium]MBK7080241.1 sulfite exporter TauE/SafE family protein [Betaproteobacteria bacterium]